MSETKYTVLERDENGHEIRLYATGEKRNERGQIVEAKGIFRPQITAENAHEHHAMRKAKILRAIESRIMDVTKTNAPAEAIASIVGKRAQVAMNDSTRTGNDAAKIVLAAVDAYQDKQESTRTNVLRHEYTIDDETKALLEQMIAERRTNVLDSDDFTAEIINNEE